jgi:hypothetical protein
MGDKVLKKYKTAQIAQMFILICLKSECAEGEFYTYFGRSSLSNAD